MCHLNHNRAATSWREFSWPITGRRKAKNLYNPGQLVIIIWKLLCIVLFNWLISFGHMEFFPSSLPSFHCHVWSPNHKLEEFDEKNYSNCRNGKENLSSLEISRFAKNKTSWWLNRTVYKSIMSVFKTPFWFRFAINMLLSNVILRCNEASPCPTIEDFYFLKMQTWASVRKCTVRLVRTLQVTDVSIPFLRWFNNLRNYKNISS